MSTATRQQKDQYENSRPWRWLSKTVITANPICQAIEPETGEQCRYPATIVHHIVAPEDCWELRNVVRNLCAVCAHHHSGGVRGDANKWNYVATREAGVMGNPDVFHIHKTVEQRQNLQSDVEVEHALAALDYLEARNRKAYADYVAAQQTAVERSNTLDTTATPTPTEMQ